MRYNRGWYMLKPARSLRVGVAAEWSMTKKLNLDKDGELKKLAEEFHQMQSVEELREKTDAAEAKVSSDLPNFAPEVRTLPLMIGAIIVVLIVVAVLVFLGGGKYLWGKKPIPLTVPSVIGFSMESARDNLVHRYHLRVQITYDATSPAATDTVISQQPMAGDSVQKGDVVRIVIAGARPNVQAQEQISPVPPPGSATTMLSVPDYIGMEASKAQSKLAAAGFKVEIVEGSDNAHPAGVVIDCDPKPDTQAPNGATISLTVNNLTTQMLSDYSGKPAEMVMDELKSKGYDPARVDVPSNAQPVGIVLGTEPKANTAVKSGEKITVIVAKQ
jgi:serine/threonine-protein kinase